MSDAPETVVIGLGNVILSDDGLGAHSLRRLRDRYPPADRIELIEGGTAGLLLLPHLADARRAIIIDAIDTGAPPGTLVRLPGEDWASTYAIRITPHDIGLRHLLAAARLTKRRVAARTRAPRRAARLDRDRHPAQRAPGRRARPTRARDPRLAGRLGRDRVTSRTPARHQRNQQTSMCLAIPAQIVEFCDPERFLARVDASGVRRIVRGPRVRRPRRRTGRRLGTDPRRIRDLPSRRARSASDPTAARSARATIRARAQRAQSQRDPISTTNKRDPISAP